jgi:glycosyltransferase involved in cell wall biosynthesis
MFFSVIIPVYNRLEELRELLDSLSAQSFQDFEVIVIEDGSSLTSESVCDSFKEKLTIHYLYQENQGQGFARNHGMQEAKGSFYVIFDSDVIVPKDYLEKLKMAIESRNLDAFGGPDAAESSFSTLQKAMDFAMTSFLTTGGIRGKMKNPASYQARGFNMGVSRQVFEETKGFVDPNRGEDIEWSSRIKKCGFKLELVKEAFVFHKRKNTLKSFFNQAYSFGQNRINVSRYHPDAVKLVHLLPSAFLVFLALTFVSGLFSWSIFPVLLLVFLIWISLVFFFASLQYMSLKVGGLSMATSILQLAGYGAGLLVEGFRKLLKG